MLNSVGFSKLRGNDGGRHPPMNVRGGQRPVFHLISTRDPLDLAGLEIGAGRVGVEHRIRLVCFGSLKGERSGVNEVHRCQVTATVNLAVSVCCCFLRGVDGCQKSKVGADCYQSDGDDQQEAGHCENALGFVSGGRISEQQLS